MFENVNMKDLHAAAFILVVLTLLSQSTCLHLKPPIIKIDRRLCFNQMIPLHLSAIRVSHLNSSNKGNPDPSHDRNKDSFILRALFSFSELLGELTNPNKKSTLPSTAMEVRSSSADTNDLDLTSTNAVDTDTIEQIGTKIKEEYEKIFWATGQMDTSLWMDNCTFSDPFSSFGGPGSTQRFKNNADNLGRFLINPKLRITSYNIEYIKGDLGRTSANVVVGWVFSSKLKLPWRPVLAAAGETSHSLNPDNGLIERYQERWKSDTWEVIKRLFVPARDKNEE